MIFVQRQGVTGTVTFSGDAARVLKNGVVVADWTTGGSIAGIPQGDGYTLQVRTGSTITSDHLAIGVVVLTLGQSNMQGWYQAPAQHPVPASGAYTWTSTGWQTVAGDGAREFADVLGHDLGNVPVAYVDGSVGGTALLQQSSSTGQYWLQTGAGTLYQNAIDKLNAAGGHAEFAIWMQGEQDAAQGKATTAQYAAGLTTLLQQVGHDAAGAHILIGGLGPTSVPANGEDYWQDIRNAQQIAAAAVADAHYVATDLGLEMNGTVHLTDASRTWQAWTLAKAALALEGAHYTGPSGLDGGSSGDLLTLGAAAGIVNAGDGADTVYGGAGADLLRGAAGADLIYGGAGIDIISGGDGNDTIFGGTGANEIYGDAGDDSIVGGSDVDLITGGDGNDTLDGGPGLDQLIGGTGDDLYIVDTLKENVTENPGEGYDTVRSLVNFQLPANVEALDLSQGAAAIGLGNTLDNLIIGNAGSNSLAGGDGNDTLIGNGGIDTLDGGSGNDTVVLHGPASAYLLTIQGANWLLQDTVGTDGTATLVNVETLAFTDRTLSLGAFANYGKPPQPLTLTGGAGNDTLNGGDLSDTLSGLAGTDKLYGGAGNDTLDGGDGVDTMVGGTGDDTYVVSDLKDVIVEAAGEGFDTIRTALPVVVLSNWANVEALVYTGTANAALTGSANADALTAGPGADTLNGAAGADTMAGGGGGDTYYVDNPGDTVVEAPGGGTDLVKATVSFTLPDNVEKLILSAPGLTGVGNALANSLTGTTGSDTLDGGVNTPGAAGDTLVGGAGDDTYYVRNANDVVTEATNAGHDVVFTSLAALTLALNVEDLHHLGDAPFAGAGNTLANGVWGGAGADTLDGGAGADTLYGGAGNDTYIVDNSQDLVVEAPGGGIDLVRTGLSTYTLPAEVEQLVFTGITGFNGSGNASDNLIQGGPGVDVLDGKAGVDTLIGGLGNDTYVVDNPGDQVVEASGAGTDTIKTSVSYALPANVETLILTAPGLTGTGNALNNLLAGTAGSDTLDGGAGSDTLQGGGGDDTYVVDSTGDMIQESLGGGTDTVRTTLSAYTLSTYLENLTFVGAGAFAGTGNASANALVGGAGNDSLYGGTGDDTLAGGGGNDRLDGGAGTDTAVFSGAWTDYAVTRVNATTVTVAHLAGAGPDGTDTLLNMEAVRFGDGTSFSLTANNAPVAGADAFAGQEDTPVTGSVLANDRDFERSPLTAALVAGPSHGAVSLRADGTFVYTPAADYNGADSFTYTASDGALSSAPTTVSVTLAPVNDAPVAHDTAGLVSADASTPLTGNVLTSATDVDGDVLQLSTTGLLHGTWGDIQLNADGSYSYAVGAAAVGLGLGEMGVDAFAFTVSDGHGGTAQATLTVSVAGVEDAPSAGAPAAVTVAQDGAAVMQDLLTAASDPDLHDVVSLVASSLVVSAVDGTGAAATIPAGAYSLSGSTLSLDPSAFASLGSGESETLTFAYAVTDQHLTSPGAFTVVVTGENDPVAFTDPAPAAQTLTESGAAPGGLLTSPAGVLGFSDPDAHDIHTVAVTYDVAGSDDRAQALLETLQPGDYALTATVDETGRAVGYQWTLSEPAFQALAIGESVTLTAHMTLSDGSASATRDIVLVVSGADDAPTLSDLSIATTAGRPVTLDPLGAAHDIDGDVLTLDALSTPAHGSAVLQDGLLLYTPDDGFTGAGSFTFTIGDGHGAETTATAQVTVADPPAPPDQADATRPYGIPPATHDHLSALEPFLA